MESQESEQNSKTKEGNEEQDGNQAGESGEGFSEATTTQATQQANLRSGKVGIALDGGAGGVNQAPGSPGEKPDEDLQFQVFVGGFHPDTQQEDVEGYFSKFGEISEIRLMKDKITKKFRGFGFVTFTSSEARAAALDHPEHIIKGKKVEIKIAQSKSKIKNKLLDEKDRKVFITGMSKRIKEKEIRDYFSQFGEMGMIKVIHETKSGNSFAFALYKDKNSLKKLLEVGEIHNVLGEELNCKPTLLRDQLKKMQMEEAKQRRAEKNREKRKKNRKKKQKNNPNNNPKNTRRQSGGKFGHRGSDDNVNISGFMKNMENGLFMQTSQDSMMVNNTSQQFMFMGSPGVSQMAANSPIPSQGTPNFFNVSNTSPNGFYGNMNLSHMTPPNASMISPNHSFIPNQQGAPSQQIYPPPHQQQRFNLPPMNARPQMPPPQQQPPQQQMMYPPPQNGYQQQQFYPQGYYNNYNNYYQQQQPPPTQRPVYPTNPYMVHQYHMNPQQNGIQMNSQPNQYGYYPGYQVAPTDAGKMYAPAVTNNFPVPMHNSHPQFTGEHAANSNKNSQPSQEATTGPGTQPQTQDGGLAQEEAKNLTGTAPKNEENVNNLNIQMMNQEGQKGVQALPGTQDQKLISKSAIQRQKSRSYKDPETGAKNNNGNNQDVYDERNEGIMILPSGMHHQGAMTTFTSDNTSYIGNHTVYSREALPGFDMTRAEVHETQSQKAGIITNSIAKDTLSIKSEYVRRRAFEQSCEMEQARVKQILDEDFEDQIASDKGQKTDDCLAVYSGSNNIVVNDQNEDRAEEEQGGLPGLNYSGPGGGDDPLLGGREQERQKTQLQQSKEKSTPHHPAKDISRIDEFISGFKVIDEADEFVSIEDNKKSSRKLSSKVSGDSKTKGGKKGKEEDGGGKKSPKKPKKKSSNTWRLWTRSSGFGSRDKDGKK